jgi:hypothetical protein
MHRESFTVRRDEAVVDTLLTVHVEWIVNNEWRGAYA